MAEARKEINSHGAKPAPAKYVGGDVAARKKEIIMLVTSVTGTREHRLEEDALTRKHEAEMELSKVWEKNLDSNWASVKELARVKVENAFL